ncbi:MAG: TonB family protein [bacterium]
MRRSGERDNPHSLKRYLFFSLLFHLVTLGLLLFFLAFESEKPLPETRVTWVQLGIRTGKEEGLPYKKSEGLPKTTIEEQKKSNYEQPPPTKEQSKKTEKKPEGVEKAKVAVEDKNKPKTKPTPTMQEKKPEGKPMDPRMKDALAKINEDLKERTATPEAAQVKEGGEGSPQGSPGGSNSECSAYSSRIKQRMIGNWIRLVGSNKPPRPPKIFLTINSSGQITSTRYTQRSGDLSLDGSALRAVESSSPLPPPPLNCEMALSGGITVQFGR